MRCHMGKILIIEDDPDVLRGLFIRLHSEGHKPSFWPWGREAVQAIIDVQPDLIILDLGLPGQDGLDVLRELGTALPDTTIPVIVLTARDPATYRNACLEAGAKYFLQKPASNEVMMSIINAEMERKSASLFAA